MMGRAIFLFMALLFTAAPLLADENSDLGLIPDVVRNQPERQEAPRMLSKNFFRLYIEDALTVSSFRETLSVPVPIDSPRWQNRTSVDLTRRWEVAQSLSFILSSRLSAFEAENLPFPSQGSAQMNFREVYLSEETFPGTFLEAGRINIRNGVALGFNPTDYFKSRSGLTQASQDPSSLRENRLGTVMFHLHKIWDSGAASIIYAPRLQAAQPITASGPASLDPLFGQTNDSDRILLTLSYDIASFSPQMLFYHESAITRVGLNVSKVICPSLVGLFEWSAAKEPDLSERAVTFGKMTGSLPAMTPVIPQQAAGASLQQDSAFGLSWSGPSKLTVNLEYHFHQSGLNHEELNRWFSLGAANPFLASELWYVRQYAFDQQEPWMQQELFVRADWPDSLVKNLELGAIAFISPYDESTTTQMSGAYFLSSRSTIASYISFSSGGIETVNGSVPQVSSAVLQLTRYF